MKTLFYRTVIFALLLTAYMTIGYAQTTGSIAGTVLDANGAIVPNATVTVKGQAGQSFTATTNDNGIYNIPAVAAGLYTVTITSNGFKTSVVNNVKVDAGTPATVNAALEVGNVQQTVEVTTGAEVLQIQTATINTNIQGRQIVETPIQSRSALDLVTLLPGTNTIGAVRTSTVNGLPKESLSVSIDGVEANNSLLRSSDGFVTFVAPRIDAIDEVTVLSSNSGAEASGDGAVQIKFVTRRGTNDYSGGLYWQHRNDALSANYWLNNRDKVARTKIRLNQYGGKFGGPLPFLNFGEGVPMFNSGKDRSFFFFNYEEYRAPETSPTRVRTILDTGAQAGLFQYDAGAGVNTVNLYTLAAAKGFTSTPDPTIANVLAGIRASTQVSGSVTPISGDLNRERLNFSNANNPVRKYLALRFDFNLTRNHSLESVTNIQDLKSPVDTLNNSDPNFPGFDNSGKQNSERRSQTVALRSTFGQNMVNEARWAAMWGISDFTPNGGTEFFTNFLGGRNLNINVTGLAAALTNPVARNQSQTRREPVYDFTDNLTWLSGNHSIVMGGQFKMVKYINDQNTALFPTVGFAVVSTDPILTQMFTTANFPGASAAQLADAAALYALLTGRVSSWTQSAVLDANGQYVPSGATFQRVKQRTYGLFVQDSWKIRSNLTLSFGVRWQPQEAYQLLTPNFAILTDPNMVYDVSGTGNLFSPGTLTGAVPTVRGNTPGEKAYPTDFNNFAPNVGVVWSPDTGEGFWSKILGGSNKSVFRAGFSRSFLREGTNLPSSVLGNNPGGALSTSRSANLGNLIGVGTLLRDPGNPNLTPAAFPATPSYPFTVTSANNAFGFSPNLKTGYVDSFSFGYQRELDKNTVVEVRYVGNRGKDIFRLYSLNETNTIENGFASEFAKAQSNLYLNIAAGRCIIAGQTPQTNPGCQNNFAYFPDVVGSQQLPIFQSFYTGSSTSLTYTNAQYSNAANILRLSRNNPDVVTLAASLATDATRRANSITAGRPVNFINNCPTTLGFCFLVDNGEVSSYDSLQLEVRRRLSNGLRVQASYVLGKAFTNGFPGATASAGAAAFTAAAADQLNNTQVTLRNPDLDHSYAQYDVRHVFKFDATYDLPVGRGKWLFSNANWATNALLGGFSLVPVVRWQSGSPFLLENVQLVGMTVKDLQKSIKARKGPSVVTYLPDDIINNTIAAFNPDPTRANGYSAQFGVPTGRFIAPAGYGNCQARFAGDCGFRRLVLFGPSFLKVDTTIIKRIKIDEKRNVELRATVFDVLNHTNWRVGGWTGNFTNVTGLGTTTFGQLGANTAYQDPFGSIDPGGRMIDLTLRINF